MNNPYYKVIVDGEEFNKIHYTDLGTFIQRIVFNFKRVEIVKLSDEEFSKTDK